MEALKAKLLNNFQRNFPLHPSPFAQIAHKLSTDSTTIITHLRQLQANGTVSRVGPVFRPNTIGASTLATMAVPTDQLDTIAALVNEFTQVNHNYEREHHYNLWFVVTASDTATLSGVLRTIQLRCGYPILVLPLIKDYHIDLGFNMQLQQAQTTQPEALGFTDGRDVSNSNEQTEHFVANPSNTTEDLIAAIQDGLPLVTHPYREIARRLGCAEQAVIDQLSQMISRGVIKRLGVVVRHHELGYLANAMVVWDIPNSQVDQIGQQLGQQTCVSLCYQRPRKLPHWRYNLFCMVHGHRRDDVINCINHMRTHLELQSLPCEILFSVRRFKQRGAKYRVGRRWTN